MTEDEDKIKKEILRAIRSYVEQHADQHPPGELYKVSLVEKGQEPLVLKSHTQGFTVIENVVKENLPENLLRIARVKHRQDHPDGERFEVKIIKDQGLSQTVEAPSYQRPKSAEPELEEEEVEEEIMLGCNCGWTATATDIMGKDYLQQQDSQDQKYDTKTKKKKSSYGLRMGPTKGGYQG